jgi:phosphate transport system substrate-binding protein
MGNLGFLIIGLSLLTSACSRETGQRRRAGASAQDGTEARVALQNKGSDTLVNVAQNWAEAYSKVAPKTPIAVTGGGTGTGVSSLINGSADIVNASRALTQKEIQTAYARGVKPVSRVVGYDAVVILVHRSNPKKRFSIQELAGIYGDGGEFERWSQLGVEVPGCANDAIVRVSRQNNSGTYEYFKGAVLGKGKEFKLGSMDLHGSKDVTDLVGKTPCAIGYSGLAYATAQVATPCIGRNAEECVTPSVQTAVDRSYPIARPLFMVTNGEPTGRIKAYLDWIQSDAGQVHRG